MRSIADVSHYKKKQVIAQWDSNLKPKEIYFKMKKLLENLSATVTK